MQAKKTSDKFRTGKLGVCPIPSYDFLSCSINVLKERGVLDTLDEEALSKDLHFLAGILPDHLFPDCIIDIPLMGGEPGGITLTLDCYERCFLNYYSKGEFFQKLGLPSLSAPKHRDERMLLCIKGGRLRMQCVNGKELEGKELFDPQAAKVLTGRFPLFQPLFGLPLRYYLEQDGEEIRVTVDSGPVHPKQKFSQQPYKETILKFLTDAGIKKDCCAMLEKAPYNLGIPYYDREDGIRRWISYMDVASLVFTFRGTQLVDCHARVRISDKCIVMNGDLSRRVQTYQWHITDQCDQRCRHCYLFAEDAALTCVSTPFDQLMLTLDQLLEDAERRESLPFLVITGGDPLLHPQFWRFAEEIHQRGLHWSILGNPFHLDPEVCRRLYQLGCIYYQLSLDGLPAYHDSMRRQGSFDATIRAVQLLNDADIKSYLMATVSRQNMEDVLACMDIAAEHFVRSFTFARYCATSPERAEQDYPSPEEYRDFLLRYYQKAKHFREQHCRTHFGRKEHLFTLLLFELGEFEPAPYAAGHPDDIFDGCHLGQAVAILPNGDLVACRRMDSVIGNVKTERIRDIVTGDLCRSYREIRNIKKCKDCELLQWCRGCRAVGYNATGDLQGADPCCWK